LFKGWQGGYHLLGWRTGNAHFAKIDVLLHPAKAEPCGMVISEAIAAQVPVVVSDACGAAAQVTEDAGEVVPLTAPLDKWVRAITINLIALKPRRSLCAEGIALRENSPPYMKL